MNTFTQFPIMAISNPNIAASYYTHQVDMCKICNCIQLRNLVDPYKLYSPNYMSASFSPSWKEHHDVFCSFILDNSDTNKFLEVGANSGTLYNLIKNKREIDYSVLDMFHHKDLPQEVKFHEGNCETFNFMGHDTIILSHVFEHLYNPHKFILRLKEANVTTVFISIPNFNRLLENRTLEIINSQHTFYCGKEHINYLFSQYGYACNSTFEYNGNYKSLMLKYTLSNISPLPIPSISKSMCLEIYNNKVNYLKEFIVPKNTYIMPAGIYGQYTYYFLSNKSNILGFLDNNPLRHGQKLFGTDKYVYMPRDLDLTNMNVILCECPYKEEIIASLREINKDIHIIVI